MLMSLARDNKPDCIIMCFDGGRPLYRERKIAQYKANRHHDDDDTYAEFLRQLAELRRILPYFGVLSVCRNGIEADDLMYHASRLLTDDVMIITNDDDLLQAVNEHVHMHKPLKKGGYSPVTLDNFRYEIGAGPEHFLRAKALLGDTSDNIPGVYGIGPATLARIYHDGQEDLSVLNPIMRKRVEDFFNERYLDVLSCISLKYDLCGAKLALLRAQWMPYTSKVVYKYCIDNAFASLIEAGSLGQIFGPLKQPAFQMSGHKFPYVWDAKRYPVV